MGFRQVVKLIYSRPTLVSQALMPLALSPCRRLTTAAWLSSGGHPKAIHHPAGWRWGRVSVAPPVASVSLTPGAAIPQGVVEEGRSE